MEEIGSSSNRRSGVSNARPRARTLQAMRASLLASAIASMLRCSRFLDASIQGLSPSRYQMFGPHQHDLSACTNSSLTYRLPRLEIFPRIVRPPSISCLHQPQPGGKVTSLLEHIPGADRRYHRARDDRPEPGSSSVVCNCLLSRIASISADSRSIRSLSRRQSHLDLDDAHHPWREYIGGWPGFR